MLVEAEVGGIAGLHHVHHAHGQRHEPRLEHLQHLRGHPLPAQHPVVAFGPGPELFPQRGGQLAVQRGAVAAQRGLAHLQRQRRRGHLLRRHLEQQGLGLGERFVHVARQRVVPGQQHVERAEQVQAVVGVGHLPQQRHRRRFGPGRKRGREQQRRGDERGQQLGQAHGHPQACDGLA